MNLGRPTGSARLQALSSSPVVVTALLWVGLQCLVLLYLRSLIGSLLHRDLHHLIALERALTEAPAHGLTLRASLWAVNLAFVLLLWLKLRSRHWPSASRRLLALAVYGGTSLLLLLVNTAWTQVLRR